MTTAYRHWEILNDPRPAPLWMKMTFFPNILHRR